MVVLSGLWAVEWVWPAVRTCQVLPRHSVVIHSKNITIITTTTTTTTTITFTTTTITKPTMTIFKYG
ncbi:hypothetical protein E2C01_044359 [Portunus trituberculatus]|uniref:Uncharacterized protein n=1 Tax=Portunus trituberculatus TaxID=210409 RepID=A0A5B7FRW9_PORTR|nr:hypothetical protein [Portunus trituberculatus]